MARENQGLQIALIIFVMLWLVFTVLAFVFYKNWDQSKTEAAANSQKEKEATQSLNTAQGEVVELKRILGFPSTSTLEAIHTEMGKDMAVAAAGLPEADRNYRTVTLFLNDTVQKKNQALAAADVEKTQLKQQLADRERDAAARIDEAKKAVDKAGEDLAQVTKNLSDQNSRIKVKGDELLGEINKTKEKAAEEIDGYKKVSDKQKNEIIAARGIAGKARNDLERVTKLTFETALGKVLWANQRSGRVFINLGEADGLRRLTSFGVFPANADDVGRIEKKAGIEVVEIMGPHLSEARITDDKPGNPIVRGDVIWTPIWAPGRRIHFALAGTLDLDGDGKSDLDRVRSIISSNGAVVDAYQNAKGGVEGAITPDTTFLVVGIPPDEKSPKDFRTGYKAMMNQAKENIVKEIKLADLLDRMGYRETNHVTRYGPAANPLDFRAKAPDGGLPVSHEPISPLFQPRQPPRGARTAY